MLGKLGTWEHLTATKKHLSQTIWSILMLSGRCEMLSGSQDAFCISDIKWKRPMKNIKFTFETSNFDALRSNVSISSDLPRKLSNQKIKSYLGKKIKYFNRKKCTSFCGFWSTYIYICFFKNSKTDKRTVSLIYLCISIN